MDWERYAAGWAARHGGYDLRRAPAAVRGWQRLGYALARGLVRLRVRSATVTLAGLALAVAVPLVAARGPVVGPLTAAALVLLSSLAGTVDRALGLLADRPSPRAAVWEVAAARLGEVGWLAGFWAVGVPGPLVVAVGAVTGLHELVRGEALAAGASRLGAQTVAERPMRVSVAVTGLALAGLAGSVGRPLAAGVLTVATALWLLLALVGFGQLAAVVQKSLH